jgi:hypothetical protein
MPYYQERQNEKVGKLYSKFPYPSFQVSQFFLDYYSKFPYPFFPSFSVFVDYSAAAKSGVVAPD